MKIVFNPFTGKLDAAGGGNIQTDIDLILVDENHNIITDELGNLLTKDF